MGTAAVVGRGLHDAADRRPGRGLWSELDHRLVCLRRAGDGGAGPDGRRTGRGLRPYWRACGDAAGARPPRRCRSGPRVVALATPAIRRHALVRQPETFGRRAGLPEDVDRNAAARLPVAADAQPARLGGRDDTLADGERRVFVESAVVAERAQVELQRLGLDEPAV